MPGSPRADRASVFSRRPLLTRRGPMALARADQRGHSEAAFQARKPGTPTEEAVHGTLELAPHTSTPRVLPARLRDLLVVLDPLRPRADAEDGVPRDRSPPRRAHRRSDRGRPSGT